MSGDQLLHIVTWSLFVLVFLVALVRLLRYPSKPSIDVALLFSGPALVSLLALLSAAGLPVSSPLIGAMGSALLLAAPYLLLRLVEDFSRVQPLAMRIAEASLVLLVAGVFLFMEGQPAWYTLAAVGYFLILQVFATVALARESRRYTGITKRRMEAVAVGTVMFGLAIPAIGLGVLLPDRGIVWDRLSTILGLVSGIGFFLGLAPPAWLRRSWQEPDLRAFLANAASLPYLPDTQAILGELERGAAMCLGAHRARIALWDESAQMLTFSRDGRQILLDPSETTGGRAFSTQRPIYSADAPMEGSGRLGGRGAFTTGILAAPITSVRRRLGVLVVYATRAPLFARDDLALMELLANQAAVILESRALIDEAAHLRARDEVAHLKEDFLSAAAHDLKTPLTVLLTQSQLLERRALRYPEEPPDLDGIQRLVAEARHLKGIVDEMLDANLMEQGQLVRTLERVDLLEVAKGICYSRKSARHRCVVEGSGEVIGEYDRARILQLVDNLVENAVKYSPGGGDVRVKVRQKGKEAYLAVSDEGIGIPAADLPHLFSRFHRGTNVDDRRFVGMGLGLYICRRIVEEHGGRLWVTSNRGRGTTFHIVLPASQAVSGGLDHDQRSHSGRR